MHFARTSTRSVAAGSVVAALALVLQGSALTAGASPAEGGQTSRALTFDVLFSPFDYTDLGQPGPSSADVIVFHDTLQQAGASVGDEVGSCTLVGADGLGSCTGVIRLGVRGTIAFAFVNAPPPHKVLAVTGGSGQFRAVRGDGTLDEKGDGTGTLVLRILR